MDPMILARWQFAITPYASFLFVPLTLKTSVLVRSCKPSGSSPDDLKRMTKF